MYLLLSLQSQLHYRTIRNQLLTLAVSVDEDGRCLDYLCGIVMYGE